MYVQCVTSRAFAEQHIQHGVPMQVVDMGETSLDEETFNEYISELREHYTADKVSRYACI